MPIIVPTIPPGGKSPEWNLSDYSHSDVFTVYHTTPFSTLEYEVPSLTTAFTAPTGCAERWLVRGKPWGPATFDGTKINTVWDIYRGGSLNQEVPDPWYDACQPYAQASAIYSPGMCPDGQTVAEITEHQTKVSTGIDSYWQASCCPSGMGFGKVKHARCQKTYATSTMAYYPITSEVSGKSGSSSTFYETTITKTVGSQNDKPVIETSTQTSVTGLAAGYAIQDPVVVAWQKQDLDLFPRDYASSLASQIKIPYTATGTQAAPAPTSDIPGPTNSPPSSSQTATPSSSELSFPAKVGVIVGSVAGLLVLSTVLICILLRQRQRRRQDQQHHDATSRTAPYPSYSPYDDNRDTTDTTSAGFLSKWWRTRGTDGNGAGILGASHARRQMLSCSTERLELEASSKKPAVELDSPAPSPGLVGEKGGGANGHHGGDAAAAAWAHRVSVQELSGESAKPASPLGVDARRR
ncbi:unnamed protein product [Periconia digitata]|uniref:Uncharacterized protein n=1 Tax=Periconia digitata TaxID=1303443 RepID=A0A9W4UDX5_9PLEO|nr:unnamed protein product [Periconia digitata]